LKPRELRKEIAVLDTLPDGLESESGKYEGGYVERPGLIMARAPCSTITE
jgi:hypothetical protein